jgi:hypothetical protein
MAKTTTLTLQKTQGLDLKIASSHFRIASSHRLSVPRKDVEVDISGNYTKPITADVKLKDGQVVRRVEVTQLPDGSLVIDLHED